MKESNTFKCENCKMTNGVSLKKMLKHLKEVHSVDSEKTKGTRSLLCHADAADFYTYTYEWNIGDVILIQLYCCKRNKPW